MNTKSNKTAPKKDNNKLAELERRIEALENRFVHPSKQGKSS